MITFLEYCGAKLGAQQRKWTSRTSPFRTNGNFRADGGQLDQIKRQPKSRQHDGTLHPKVERLREGSSTTEILTPQDVQYICKLYDITDLNESTPKQLSNTGIVIEFNPQINSYHLKRHV